MLTLGLGGSLFLFLLFPSFSLLGLTLRCSLSLLSFRFGSRTLRLRMSLGALTFALLLSPGFIRGLLGGGFLAPALGFRLCLLALGLGLRLRLLALRLRGRLLLLAFHLGGFGLARGLFPLPLGFSLLCCFGAGGRCPSCFCVLFRLRTLSRLALLLGLALGLALLARLRFLGGALGRRFFLLAFRLSLLGRLHARGFSSLRGALLFGLRLLSGASGRCFLPRAFRLGLFGRSLSRGRFSLPLRLGALRLRRALGLEALRLALLAQAGSSLAQQLLQPLPELGIPADLQGLLVEADGLLIPLAAGGLIALRDKLPDLQLALGVALPDALLADGRLGLGQAGFGLFEDRPQVLLVALGEVVGTDKRSRRQKKRQQRGNRHAAQQR